VEVTPHTSEMSESAYAVPSHTPMHWVGDSFAHCSDGVSHELPGFPIGDISPEPQSGEAVAAHGRSRQSPELSRLAEGTAHNPTEWVNHWRAVCHLSHPRRFTVSQILRDFLPYYCACREPVFRGPVP